MFLRGGVTSPVFAGYWEEVYNPYIDQYGRHPSEGHPDYDDYLAEEQDRADGTVSYSIDTYDYYNYGWQHHSNSYPWHEDIDFAGFMPLAIDFEASGGQITVNSIGKRRTKFHWVRDNPNDDPPTNLILRITASALGGASSDTTGQDRDTSKESITLSVAGENGGTDQGNQYEKWEYSTVTKSYVVPTHGQDIVYGPWINYGVLIYVDGDRFTEYYDPVVDPEPYYDYYPGRGSINLSYDAQVDDRAVHISSNAEASYHKGQDGNPEINERRLDGSMTADSAVSQDKITGIWLTDISFHAHQDGDWNQPDYVWAGNIFGAQQGNTDTTSTIYSLGNGVDPDPPATVAVMLEDTDSSVRINTYKVRWHRTWENPQIYQTQDESPDQFIGGYPVTESITDTPPYAMHSGSVKLNWTNSPYWAMLDSNEVKTVVGAIGVLKIPGIPIKPIAQAAGVALESLEPVNNQQTVIYDNCWYDDDPITNTPTATWDGSPVRPYSQYITSYQMVPHIAVGHKLHFIEHDMYDSHGYTGPQKTVVETDTSWSFIGEFYTP